MPMFMLSCGWVNLPEPKQVSATLGSQLGVLVRDGLSVKGLAKRWSFPVSVTESLVKCHKWQREQRD